MKALSYLGPEQMMLIEKEAPIPQKGEALIRIKACGICGSDIHGYLGLTGRRIPPVTMGHEFAGEIVELDPSGGHGFSIGDRVVVQPINFCGECVFCRNGITNLCSNKLFFGVLEENGAMAEYVSVPTRLLYPIPFGCAFQTAALTEPLAVAYSGLSGRESLITGKHVLIIGAGTIGLCALALVRNQSPASVIVSDISHHRRKTALAAGADHTVNPVGEDFYREIFNITGGEMIDLSVEAVGVEPSANQSIKCLAPGGVTVWLGMSAREMTINMQDIVTFQRSVLGSFNYTHKQYGEAAALLGEGKVELSHLITAQITIDEAPEMFAKLAKHADEFLKVMITF